MPISADEFKGFREGREMGVVSAENWVQTQLRYQLLYICLGMGAIC